MSETLLTPSTSLPSETDTRLPFWKLAAWAGAGVSAGANAIVLGYLSLYATDTLGLSPATIGTVIAVGVLVGAVTSLFASYIVDRSPETRWGKARPYELAVPLTWLATALLFSAPGSAGTTTKIAWVAVSLLVIRGICDPLLRSNDLLYMARAFANRAVYTKVQTRAAMFTTLGAIAITVILPQVLQRAGKSPTAWSMTISVYALIMAVIGLTRFIWVKEVFKRETHQEPLKFREMLSTFRTNKWMWLFAIAPLLGGVISGENVGGYYFRYVVGNLGLQGVLAAVGLVILPLLLLVPRLMRRYALAEILMTGAALGIVGAVLNFFAGANLVVLVIGGLLTGVAGLVMAYLPPVILLDLATFNESQGHRRLESTLGATIGIITAIGTAVSSQLVGQLLHAAGYDGTAAQQNPTALFTIRVLFGAVPAVLYLGIAITYFLFRRFEKDVLPRAQERVAAARAEETSYGEPGYAAMDVNADGVVEPNEVAPAPIAYGASGFQPMEPMAQQLGPITEPDGSAAPRRSLFDDEPDNGR